MTKLFFFLLIFSSLGIAQFVPSPTQTGAGGGPPTGAAGGALTGTYPNPGISSGSATAATCAGSPGNTTGAYKSQCQATASGNLYVCNNPAGCSVAADWVGIGTTLPTYAQAGGTGSPNTQACIAGYPVVQYTASGQTQIYTCGATTANQYGINAVTTTNTSTQTLSGPLNACQINNTFYAHCFTILYPTGCTVNAVTVTTPLECAVINTNAALAVGIEAKLKLSAEVYNVAATMTLANSSGASCLAIEGAGFDNSVINVTASMGDVFAQQSTGTLARCAFSGMRIQANKLANNCLNFPYLNRARIQDINCLDTLNTGFIIGGNEITASNLKANINGSYNTGTGAGLIPTISGGNLTALLPAGGVASVSVTNVGSGYTAPTLSWTGGNCEVYPTGSLTTSGTSPNLTITAVTVYIKGFCAESSPPSVTVTDSTGTGFASTVNMATGYQGSNYSSSAFIAFYGYGASGQLDKPCTTLPIVTGTFTGGALTGTSITGTGIGCTSNTFAQVVDLNNSSLYGFQITATDSSFYDIGGAIGLTANIYVSGTGTNYFYHPHPQGTPTGFLNTAKSTHLIGAEFDSNRQYAIDTSTSISVNNAVMIWDQNGPYSGAGFLHTSSTNAYNSVLNNIQASEQQGYGGYTFLIDSALGAFTTPATSTFPVAALFIADARPTFSSGPNVSVINSQGGITLLSSLLNDISLTSPDLVPLIIGAGATGATQGISLNNGRSFVGFDNTRSNAILQGSTSKGVGLLVNNATIGSGTYTLHCGTDATCGVGPSSTATTASGDPVYWDANGLTHLNGTAPAASSGSVTGTNSGGYISGLSAATTVTLTFANSGFTTWAACSGTPSVSLATPIYVSAQSNTACTFTMPALTGTLYYHVDGK